MCAFLSVRLASEDVLYLAVAAISAILAGLLESCVDRGVISIVMAGDDLYAMPLTVAAYSAIRNLKHHQKADIYILDGGIAERSKRKILRSLDADGVHIHWIKPVSPRLEDFWKKANKGRYPLPAYYRLLLPEILPNNVRKLIYLDADVIVLEDLAGLWDIDIGDYCCLAVQEPDDPHVIDCFQRSNPHISVYDLEKYGVTPEHKYFNSGVMVINLEKWRQDGVMEKAFGFLDTHSPRYADQDVLNVVVAGRWGALAPRWNQTGAFYHRQRNNPYTAEVTDQVVQAPFIVHFTWWPKPWAHDAIRNAHPRAHLFFEMGRRTAWAGTIRRTYWLRRLRHGVRSVRQYSRHCIKWASSPAAGINNPCN
jgi:lipopolysaccharide biosynthesis glycosyltransferase